MTCRFVVQTEKGTPDRLTTSTRIAFTLTPVEPKVLAHPYQPVVRWVADFPADTKSTTSVEWFPKFCFRRYRAVGGKCALRDEGNEGTSDNIPPGHYVELFQPENSERVDWRAPRPSVNHMAAKQFSVMMKNSTGQEQLVALLIDDGDEYGSYVPIVAYRPLGNEEPCAAPSELVLQAYIVRSPFIQKGSILRQQDMSLPLLPATLSCDSLPMSSVWKLSQDSNGVVRLASDSQPAEPLHAIEAKVDKLSKSITNISTRFSLLEKSVASAQDGVKAGHQAISDLQGQLSKIEKSPTQPRPPASDPSVSRVPTLDQRLPALEEQTKKLAQSFTQTQDYLSSVQKFLQNTRQQMASLDSKVPVVEAKVEKLAGAFGYTQGDVSAAQNSVVELGLRVTAVEEKGEELAELLKQVLEGSSTVEDLSPTVFPSRDHRNSLPSAELPSHPPSDDFPDLPVFRN